MPGQQLARGAPVGHGGGLLAGDHGLISTAVVASAAADAVAGPGEERDGAGRDQLAAPHSGVPGKGSWTGVPKASLEPRAVRGRARDHVGAEQAQLAAGQARQRHHVGDDRGLGARHSRLRVDALGRRLRSVVRAAALRRDRGRELRARSRPRPRPGARCRRPRPARRAGARRWQPPASARPRADAASRRPGRRRRPPPSRTPPPAARARRRRAGRGRLTTRRWSPGSRSRRPAACRRRTRGTSSRRRRR